MNIKKFAAVAAVLSVFAASVYSTAMAQTAPPKPPVVTTADVPGDDSRHGDSGGADRREAERVCKSRGCR